jgi:phosphoribosyl-AMP cyclohydrolase
MLAWMNREALESTVTSGQAVYWSRSRRALWKKGETSGNVQNVTELRVDCDQDAVWLGVNVAGHDATCHTGRRSCFYRMVELKDGIATLRDDGGGPLFDPSKVY